MNNTFFNDEDILTFEDFERIYYERIDMDILTHTVISLQRIKEMIDNETQSDIAIDLIFEYILKLLDNKPNAFFIIAINKDKIYLVEDMNKVETCIHKVAGIKLYIYDPKEEKFIIFFDCTTGVLRLPSSASDIGRETFKGNSRIKEVILPDTLTTIGVEAFKDCKNLSTVKAGKNLMMILDSAFANCINLKTIELSKALTSIGASTFADCHSLEAIFLPSLLTIETYAFFGCDKLTIYTENDEAWAEEMWSPYWNPSNRPVVWEYNSI